MLQHCFDCSTYEEGVCYECADEFNVCINCENGDEAVHIDDMPFILHWIEENNQAFSVLDYYEDL